MSQDLFSSNFTIPNDTIVICGAGDNANGNYHKVKDDWYKIACNAAIGMPLKFDAWGVADSRVTEHQYFHQHNNEFQGVRFFAEELILMGFDDKPNTYRFNTERGISAKAPHYYPEADCLKMGGTISGAMIQLAYWFGIDDVKIRLLGIQLTGKDYFDGSQSRKSYDQYHAVRKALNKMVKYMVRDLGCDIKSLNETHLGIEVI